MLINLKLDTIFYWFRRQTGPAWSRRSWHRRRRTPRSAGNTAALPGPGGPSKGQEKLPQFEDKSSRLTSAHGQAAIDVTKQ